MRVRSAFHPSLCLLGYSKGRSSTLDTTAKEVLANCTFQLLHCTYTQRSFPYSRASIQLEVGVTPSSASFPFTSAEVGLDRPGQENTEKMTSGRGRDSAAADSSTRKSSSSSSKRSDRDECVGDAAEVGPLQFFSLEESNRGGIALMSLPTSLLANYPTGDSSRRAIRPHECDKDTKEKDKRPHWGHRSANLAGSRIHGVRGVCEGSAMRTIPSFSPLSLLFSSETGKVKIPGSVHVVSLNQHVRAPLQVYEACFENIYREVSQHLYGKGGKRIYPKEDTHVSFSSPPLVSFVLELSVDFPLLSDESASERVRGRGTGRGRGRSLEEEKPFSSSSSIVIRPNLEKGRGGGRGREGRVEEDLTCGEQPPYSIGEEGDGHGEGLLPLGYPSPSHSLPFAGSSSMASAASGKHTGIGGGRKGKEAENTVLIEGKSRTEETLVAVRRGRGRPPGAKNKKGGSVDHPSDYTSTVAWKPSATTRDSSGSSSADHHKENNGNRKNDHLDHTTLRKTSLPSSASLSDVETPIPKKGRGRPRKTPPLELVDGVDTGITSRDNNNNSDTRSSTKSSSREAELAGERHSKHSPSHTPLGALNDPSVPVSIDVGQDRNSTPISKAVGTIMGIMKTLQPRLSGTSGPSSSTARTAATAEEESAVSNTLENTIHPSNEDAQVQNTKSVKKGKKIKAFMDTPTTTTPTTKVPDGTAEAVETAEAPDEKDQGHEGKKNQRKNKKKSPVEEEIFPESSSLITTTSSSSVSYTGPHSNVQRKTNRCAKECDSPTTTTEKKGEAWFRGGWGHTSSPKESSLSYKSIDGEEEGIEGPILFSKQGARAPDLSTEKLRGRRKNTKKGSRGKTTSPLPSSLTPEAGDDSLVGSTATPAAPGAGMEKEGDGSSSHLNVYGEIAAQEYLNQLGKSSLTKSKKKDSSLETFLLSEPLVSSTKNDKDMPVSSLTRKTRVTKESKVGEPVEERSNPSTSTVPSKIEKETIFQF